MNQQFIGTKPISENLFDKDKLEDFLKKNVYDFSGNLKIEQFKGGQSNPTFKITADEKNYVIRRKPPGKLLPSAHAVDREYKVISALRILMYQYQKRIVFVKMNRLLELCFM